MPKWGFSGVAHAKYWPERARADGIPVGTSPRAGSVGVMMTGQYGHVVWVESVNANGTINVSQYNYFNAGGSGWGHYSEMYNVSPNAYNYYIYF
jgi:surface antigen